MTLKLALFMYDVSMYLNRKITINEDLIEILIIFFEDIYDNNQKDINTLLEIDKKEDISMIGDLVVLFKQYLDNIVDMNMVRIRH